MPDKSSVSRDGKCKKMPDVPKGFSWAVKTNVLHSGDDYEDDSPCNHDMKLVQHINAVVTEASEMYGVRCPHVVLVDVDLDKGSEDLPAE